MKVNYLKNKNVKFDQKMKSLLIDLKEVLHLVEAKVLIFNTYKDYVLYEEDSSLDEQYIITNNKDSEVYNYIVTNMHDISNEIGYKNVSLLDETKLILEINYHTANENNNIGFLILELQKLNFNFNPDDLKPYMNKINHLIKEVAYLSELSFLKSENYGKLYALIDNFHDIIGHNDRLTPIHMSNVAQWAMELSSEFNLNETETASLYFSSMIHDIGKIYVPHHILYKTEALNDDELQLLKQHSEKGYVISKSIVMGIPSLSSVPDYIKHHHEHYDGSGYPDKLKGDDIPFISQIILVCDSIDSLMSKQEYNSANTVNLLIEELKKYSGTKFNPTIVNAMIKILLDENVVSRKNFLFDNLAFIPNVSISFFYKDIKNIITFQGNFIVNNVGGEIVIHNDDFNLNNYNSKDIYQMKMMLIDRSKLYEFSVDINSVSKNSIYVNKLIQLPADKYFSVYWQLDLIIEEDINLKSYRIGADSLSFNLDINDSNQSLITSLADKVNTIVDLKLNFVIESVEEDVEFKGIINTAFNFGEKMIYNISYRDISDVTRDKLFRYLFKRQIEFKKTL